VTFDGLTCVAEAAILAFNAIKECRDMTTGSDFLNNWIAGPSWNNPQARVLGHQNGVTTGGTDWTMVGSDTDSVVVAQSAMNIGSGGDPYLGHKLMYHNMPSISGDPLNHMALVYTQWNSTQTFADYYCDYNAICTMSPSSVSALQSNWYASTTYTPEVVAVKAIEYNTW